MPHIRVELTNDAADDLDKVVKAGLLKPFLGKLVKLEEDGPIIGEALGAALVNWKKIVVGDRQWRIVFITDPAETIATVWVMGDRDDAECYREAQKRIDRLGGQRPETTSLAALLSDILTRKQESKRRKR